MLFYECTSLASVTIPEGVTKIGNDAFYGCTSIESIDVKKGNLNYSSIDGILYDISGKKLILCPQGKKAAVIPDSVTEIGSSAFSGCKSLASITIPDSVKRIGWNAFENCTSLTSITIPDSVTEIGDSAFWNCESLTSITIPDSVTKIGDCSFSDCTSLASVTMPKGVTTIGEKAFANCNSVSMIKFCNYTIKGESLQIGRFKPDKINEMLESKNYSVQMDHPIKHSIIIQVFLNTAQPEAEAYIKKNALKIIKWLIDADDYATIKGLFESGKFVTKRNIAKFIDHSVAHTQNGGDMQIQAYIMDYKNEHFPDMDPLKNVKRDKL